MTDLIDSRLDGFPVVRIHNLILENFKNTEYGEIDFSCSKKYIPHGTKADLLGLYGQNGSGKTSMVDAIEMIQYLWKGQSVPQHFADCVMRGKKDARIEIKVDLQYPNGDVRKVIYEVVFTVENGGPGEIPYQQYNNEMKLGYKSQKRIRIVSECLKAAGTFDGDKKTGKAFLSTEQMKPFGPATKCKELCPDSEDLQILHYNRIEAERESKSFVFMDETRKIFNKQLPVSHYADIIFDLNVYAQFYLYIVKTGNMGPIRMGHAVPISFREPVFIGSNMYTSTVLSLKDTSPLPDELFMGIRRVFDNINPVLSKLIPGLTLELKSLGPVTIGEGIQGQYVEVYSHRDGKEMPLRLESDGVIKLISTLQLLIDSFNDESMTVVIDEYDAGIFEYLLGVIVEIYADYGKGQLIFTSHNLRALETIDKAFIMFTTVNPKNRYCRMKDVKTNNNLRDMYFRTIEGGGQDEVLYNLIPKKEILDAFQGAFTE